MTADTGDSTGTSRSDGEHLGIIRILNSRHLGTAFLAIASPGADVIAFLLPPGRCSPRR